MNRSARSWVISLSAAVLSAGLLTAAGQAPAVGAQEQPLLRQSALGEAQAAVDATRSTQRLRYTVALTVGARKATAIGRVDLRANRTALVVAAGGRSSEFRRIGSSYFVDAARLGSTGRRWVALDSSIGTSQMSLRAVTGLVAAASPQALLGAVRAATAARLIGTDSSGRHYRVDAPQLGARFVPLIGAFGSLPAGAGTASRLDVWVDAAGRVGKLQSSGPGYSTVFTLQGFGEPVSVPVPAASTTGGVGSASGTFLFGAGLRLPSVPVSAPTLTVSPSTEFVDGIVRGRINPTSSAGHSLRYTAEPGSKGGKLTMGTVLLAPAASDSTSFTLLPYANWLDDGEVKGPETFRVRVREVTPVDRYLTRLPLIGAIASPVIDLLQDMPDVRDRFAHVIGKAALAQITVNVGEVAPDDTPIAFTRLVPGYRGTPISTNFFPAAGLGAGQVAPLILQGAPLAAPGNTNPYQVLDARTSTAGTSIWRDAAYNVITWDPRGTYSSGGVLELNDPFFEGVDTRAILTWATRKTPVELDFGDPKVGMVGGSYGGGIQLITAGLDPRIDAISPATTWSSLIDSLQPNGVLDTSAASALLKALSAPSIRVDSRIILGLKDAVATGRLSTETLALLASADVSALLAHLQAPTLLWQSTSDPVIPLREASANAQAILGNPFGVPVKIGWFNGKSVDSVIISEMTSQTVVWMDTFVKGSAGPDGLPLFQWRDQDNVNRTSGLLPFEDGFNSATPLTATSPGATLTVKAPGVLPVTSVALNVAVPENVQIAATPTLRFRYTGQGTARSLYVSILDASTGEPLAPVTLAPVKLDGRNRGATVTLSGIAFTGKADSAVRVVLSGSIPQGGRLGTGVVTVTDVVVSVPQKA